MIYGKIAMGDAELRQLHSTIHSHKEQLERLQRVLVKDDRHWRRVDGLKADIRRCEQRITEG